MTMVHHSGGAIATLPSRIETIRRVLRAEYLNDNQHPWLVAYSGGKDSTLLLQLVWEAITDLPPEALLRPVMVVGNDTLVESPAVIQHLRDSLEVIRLAGERQQLPIQTIITVPAIDQTFWVNVIGRGYIPPTRNFRWCTDRMKILPTNRLLRQITGGSGGSVLLIGSRRTESENRRRGMDKRGVLSNAMNPHGQISDCWMFAPLADLDDNDVWLTLMQRVPPWGGTHRRLITLYRNAGNGECPLVISKDQAPSCGSASPRFGCWTCTVVKKDRSLRGLIDSGYEDAERLQALFDFRLWLIMLRENNDYRLPVRRDGNAKWKADGSRVYGPFTLEVRKEILSRLRLLERQVSCQLILPAEVECIQDIWWRDEIREHARISLRNNFVQQHPHDSQ